MNITVQVDEITLDTVIRKIYDDDDGPATYTVGDAVAFQLVDRIVRSESWPSLRDRVTEIRDEAIRDRVAPLIEEALTGSIQKTNLYGEPTGQQTTLREVIMAEVKRAMTKPTDSYSRSGQTIVGKIVADEVSKAFTTVVRDEVEKAKALVAEQIGAAVAERVQATLKRV